MPVARKRPPERKGICNLQFVICRWGASASTKLRNYKLPITNFVIGCQGLRNGNRSRVVWRDGGPSRTGNLARDNKGGATRRATDNKETDHKEWRIEMADLQQLEEQIVGLSLLDAAQLVK
ncbi:MAG: hypothetical protein WCC59_11775, partial [Terriglobales bacterium]